ncbi:MAG: hypothetical protein WCH39_30245, partial [Schlesneria sp.]
TYNLDPNNTGKVSPYDAKNVMDLIGTPGMQITSLLPNIEIGGNGTVSLSAALGILGVSVSLASSSLGYVPSLYSNGVQQPAQLQLAGTLNNPLAGTPFAKLNLPHGMLAELLPTTTAFSAGTSGFNDGDFINNFNMTLNGQGIYEKYDDDSGEHIISYISQLKIGLQESSISYELYYDYSMALFGISGSVTEPNGYPIITGTATFHAGIDVPIPIRVNAFDVGSIHLQTDVTATGTFTFDSSSLVFSWTVDGSFDFVGQHFQVPTLTISTPPESSADITNAIVKQIISNAPRFFSSLISTPGAWANSCHNGVVTFGGDTASTMMVAYNLGRSSVQQILQTAGYASDVIT